MPETNHDTPLVDAIKSKFDASNPISGEQIRAELAPLYPETEFIDIGSESIVIAHPNDSNKVIAIEYAPRSTDFPLDFSEVYHIHRILSVLFPESFPRIYAKAQGKHGGSVRQRVNDKKIGSEIEKPTDPEDILNFAFSNLKEGIRLYKVLVGQAKNVGIDLAIDAGNPDNFRIDANGNVLYLDLVQNRSDSFSIDLDKAIEVINQRTLPTLDADTEENIKNQQINTLLSSERRIKELALIKSYYRRGENPNQQEIERTMQDVIKHSHLTSGDSTHFVTESKRRINNDLRIVREMDPVPSDDAPSQDLSEATTPDPDYLTQHDVDVVEALEAITSILNSTYYPDSPENLAKFEEAAERFNTNLRALGEEVDNNGGQKNRVVVLMSKLVRGQYGQNISEHARQFLEDRLDLLDQSIDSQTDPRNNFSYLKAITCLVKDEFGDDEKVTELLKKHKEDVRAGMQYETLFTPILRTYFTHGDQELQEFAEEVANQVLEDDSRQEWKKYETLALLVDADTEEEVQAWMPFVYNKIVPLITRYGLDGDQVFSAWLESTPRAAGMAVPGYERPKTLSYAIRMNLTRMQQLEERMPNVGICKRLADEFGIVCFGRYPTDVLIKQFQHADHNNLPYGVVVFPHSDHNGAFYNDSKLINTLAEQLKDRYYLRISEAQDKIGLVSNLRKARRRYGDKHKISFAIIGGHGNPETIRFGKVLGGKSTRLSIDDLDDPRAIKAADYFVDDPTIVLFSCSTGFKDGIGSRLSQVLGATVIAPDDATSIREMNVGFDVNNRPTFKVLYPHAVENVFKKGMISDTE